MRTSVLARRVASGGALVAVTATLALSGTAPATAAPHKWATRSANIQPHVITTTVNGQKVMKVQGLESGSAKGVYCHLVDHGFNSVTLDIPLLQATNTSTTITARPVGAGASPTPTDTQLRKAIRNARSCGVAHVILKPHLEVVGGEWRAHIKGSAKWQAAWTKTLVHYAKIGKQEGAWQLVTGVEQKGATLPAGSTTRWKGTIATLRKAAPGLRLSYAAHSNDELLLLGPSFVRTLDELDVTWYPRPPKGVANPTVAQLEADMRLDKARYFDPAQKRYAGKHLVFAETGFRSIDQRDRDAKGAEATAAARVDLGIQERQYKAMLHFVGTLKYVDGVMLYRTLNSSADGGRHDAGFTWQNKPAEAVITTEFNRR